MKTDIDQILTAYTQNQSLQEKIVNLFYKVRDIPYGNINSRNAVDVFLHNKGTCSGKHQLLKQLYTRLGIPVKECLVMHKFNTLPVYFPKHIHKILHKINIVDPHNFLKIQVDNKWITVDATWDLYLEKFGFPVNKEWDGFTNMLVLVNAESDVFETENSIELKKELLSKIPDIIQTERKHFLSELTHWLDNERQKDA